VKLRITIEGRTYDVDVELVDELASSPAPLPAASVKIASPLPATPPARGRRGAKQEDDGILRSPFAAVVVSVAVAVGQKVAKGDLLMVIEAMKMETSIVAEADGTVKAVAIAVGEPVKPGQALVEFE
jgi:biotin carboxyl carrier protein